MLLGWMYERIRAAARGCQREQDPVLAEQGPGHGALKRTGRLTTPRVRRWVAVGRRAAVAVHGSRKRRQSSLGVFVRDMALNGRCPV